MVSKQPLVGVPGFETASYADSEPQARQPSGY